MIIEGIVSFIFRVSLFQVTQCANKAATPPSAPSELSLLKAEDLHLCSVFMSRRHNENNCTVILAEVRFGGNILVIQVT